jgi:hypothetical protein
MIFHDGITDEEIDKLTDPDDPVLLESDRNRTEFTLIDIARIMRRTIRSLTPEQKAELQRAVREKLKSNPE